MEIQFSILNALAWASSSHDKHCIVHFGFVWRTGFIGKQLYMPVQKYDVCCTVRIKSKKA